MGGRRISVHLSIVIVCLLLVVSLIIATIQYLESSRQRVAAAENAFASAENVISARIAEIMIPAESAIEIIARNPIMQAASLQERLDHCDVLAQFLTTNPNFASAFVGYPDGSFILVRPLPDEAVREAFEAPDEARYLVQVIQRPDTGLFIYLDAELNELARVDRPAYTSYDPRTRPWFQLASQSQGLVDTTPYLFFTTNEVGTTLALREDSGAVVGIDLTLAALGGWIEKSRPVDGADIALVNDSGAMIAHPDPERVAVPDPDNPGQLLISNLDSPANNVLAAAVRASGENPPGQLFTFTMEGGMDYRGLVTPVSVLGTGQYDLVMAVAAQDLFANSRAVARKLALILCGVLLVGIVVAVLVSRHIARPLVRLAADVQSVGEFDFEPTDFSGSRIREIDHLAQAIGTMKDTIRKFLDISTAIAAEPDLDRLLDRVLDEIIATTRTMGGVLYLTSADGRTLVPQAARSSGRHDVACPTTVVSLDENERLLVRSIADENALAAEATEEEMQQTGLMELCAAMGKRPSHLLAVPLFNRTLNLIGVLLLMKTEVLPPAQVRFAERLSGSAAVALETRQLIEVQRELFESFLQLIAQAIDTKSPYTGGHCARVPELTKMLAHAAETTSEGPYAGFALSADDWEAIHVASWLHDCGKITTPEFVVDKATKLETIYDRIHEVRMRIEVMKREAEIAYLKDVIDNGEHPERKAELDAQLAQLDEDFAFLAESNIGGEFMSDEQIARLRDLAGRTWTRTLDNRLGVSELERARMDRQPPSPLPVSEPLLSDRVDHVFERPESEKLPPDNPWGFKVDVPEHLYNRGEIHNLSIRRGTLTDEDRYKINEHMVQTIKMLDALPFPSYLQSVPEIAGGHHEKMDGTGYPKRLDGTQMSPVARMMAIADIFEALTAADRPYKKAKKLSEALRIMTFMVKDRHIDAELFDLFLTSGVYRTYADRFLSPEQIDAIDIADYRPDLSAA